MSQVKHLAIATLAILVLVAVPAQSTQSLIFDQGFSAGLPVGIAGGFVWWTGNVNEGLHGQEYRVHIHHDTRFASLRRGFIRVSHV